MFNKELVVKAHEETKKIRTEYPEITYSFQFGLEMKYLLSQIKGVENMIKLIGSQKQIAWAEKIRNEKMGDWKKEVDFMKDAENKKYVVELTAAAERIFSIESASTWIDLKGHSIVALARADMKKRLNRYCFNIGTEKAFADRY